MLGGKGGGDLDRQRMSLSADAGRVATAPKRLKTEF